MRLSRHLWLDIDDAWKSLRRRPLRSLLSGLGIGIGVAALIAMLSIGEGAKKAAYEKIGSMGVNTLRIEAAKATGHGSSINLSQGIREEDGIQLQQWLGGRGTVGAYVRKDRVPVRAGNITRMATVVGVTDGWFAAERVAIAGGRAIDAGDIAYRGNACVLGGNLAAALQSGVLAMVRIDNLPSTVVGVAAPRGRLLTEGTGLSTVDFDNLVILPISTMPFARRVAGRLALDGLIVSLETSEESEILALAGQVRQLLLQSHRHVEDFNMVVPVTLLREARENQKVFSVVMGAIAGLSLLVGGIGVMNVMLAHIAEQTREIGLRMALGAPRARIVSLYLWNSVLLTLLGGLWGVMAGVLLALCIEKIAGWEVVFSTFSLIMAPLSAIATGLVFGLHPARRAASLAPAIALRDS